jgi:hypothetical protein
VIACSQEHYDYVLSPEITGTAQHSPGTSAMAGVKAFQVNAVMDNGNLILGDTMPVHHVSLDHLGVGDHPCIRTRRQGTGLNGQGQAVPEPACSQVPDKRSPRRRMRAVQVRLVAPTAKPDYIVCPRLAKTKDNIIARLCYVVFYSPGKGEHAMRTTKRHGMQNLEAYGRMRRGLVTPAHNSDMVASVGQIGGKMIQVAFCAASGGVAHVHQRKPHCQTPVTFALRCLPKATLSPVIQMSMCLPEIQSKTSSHTFPDST